jgi:hypothetical protein
MNPPHATPVARSTLKWNAMAELYRLTSPNAEVAIEDAQRQRRDISRRRRIFDSADHEQEGDMFEAASIRGCLGQHE